MGQTGLTTSFSFSEEWQVVGQGSPKDGRTGKTDVNYSVSIPNLQAECLASDSF